MAGVLHPVGPEPAQTYWWRRLLVLAAAVAIVLTIVLATTVAGGAATVTANPPPPATPASVEPGPAEPASVAATTPSASTRASAAADGRASVTASSRPAPRATASTRPKPAPRPTATKTGSAAPKLAACVPSKLRATLTGKRTLKPRQDNVFALSLINGSKTSCVISVRPDNFELKIYSGADRIWSSNDCSRAIGPLTRAVRSEEAVEWQLRWNGRRSLKDCRLRPEVPRPGTYIATAQYQGAQPVQLGMTVRG